MQGREEGTAYNHPLPITPNCRLNGQPGSSRRTEDRRPAFHATPSHCCFLPPLCKFLNAGHTLIEHALIEHALWTDALDFKHAGKRDNAADTCTVLKVTNVDQTYFLQGSHTSPFCYPPYHSSHSPVPPPSLSLLPLPSHPQVSSPPHSRCLVTPDTTDVITPTKHIISICAATTTTD